MTAGWVAASTRGRSMLQRTVGSAGTQALAEAGSWSEARDRLATTVYGASVPADADRTTARVIADAATVWQLRVLAGWLPPASSGLARAFAAAFEIAAIDRHLARLRRREDSWFEPPRRVELGSLATAWPRVERTTTTEQVRRVLARSAWGDPGGDDTLAIRVGLRVAWGRRLLRQAPTTTDWVHGAAAVLVARERFLFEREIPDVPARLLDRMLGSSWRTAPTVATLAERLPASAAWSLSTRSDPTPEALWRSELAVIDRVDRDAHRTVDTGRNSRAAVAAVMALLLVDLWRVTAAIEAAGRVPTPSEVFVVGGRR